MPTNDWSRSSFCSDNTCVEVTWVSASACSGGQCVEVGCDGDLILVRNSRDPDGPVLSCTMQEWSAFLNGARNGEFDFD